MPEGSAVRVCDERTHANMENKILESRMVKRFCEDSRTAVKIGLAKIATSTVGKLHKGVFAQRAVFHSVSSDTWHTKPFRNSQLRRNDGCPFSAEMRRDYPLGINESPGKRKTSLTDIIELSADPHELGRTLLLGKRGFKLRRGRKGELIFDRRSPLIGFRS
ncbi:hypothetical protein AVEN_197030-1 [Araneus ventricosus]|uniref:Uncharacterized protein n=1 Tax=Araneus ventricosus TaxID=182803 RepID=A0A4Y2GFI7_ARAVE|nr:hypothetical protein AVEN_197030-1 [Araneus ventricosus]